MITRGGTSTAATSKMERFVIIVNGFQQLTITKKRSILDVAAVLFCRKRYEFFVTLIYLCTDLYFLCEYFLYLSVIKLSTFTTVLVIET